MSSPFMGAIIDPSVTIFVDDLAKTIAFAPDLDAQDLIDNN